MSDLTDKSIGHYHILEQLGEGGMAIVYKAYDTHLERVVAVKMISRDAFPPIQLEKILKRFEREAKALGRLSHSNIIKVYDYGEYENAPYLVMEYLPGGTLKEQLGKPICWQEAVNLLLPIARALDYAHRQGFVHRDVKPANILITSEGTPMLTDFGIVKLLEGEEKHTLTGTGMGVGTPEYMAPEQWTGALGPGLDIYSFGVVLYELITGRKPYTADTPGAILMKQLSDPLPMPSQFVPDLPEGVEKILLKSLAKKPENRYKDMGAFVKALEALVGGQSRMVPETIDAKIPAVQLEEIIEPETTISRTAISVNPNGKTLSAEPQAPRHSASRRQSVFRQLREIGLVILVIVLFGYLTNQLLIKPTAQIPGQTTTATQTLNYYLYIDGLMIGLGLSIYSLVRLWAARKRTGASSLIWAISSGMIWSLAYIFEIVLPGMPLKVNSAILEYVGIPFLPVAIFTFAMQYSGRGGWLTTKRILLLSILPAVTFVLSVTNSWHRLLWIQFSMPTGSAIGPLSMGYGPWYFIVALYSYALILVAAIFLIRDAIQEDTLRPSRVIIMVIGIILPWVLSAIRVFRLNTYSFIDWTPLAFSLTVIAILVGFVHE